MRNIILSFLITLAFFVEAHPRGRRAENPPKDPPQSFTVRAEGRGLVCSTASSQELQIIQQLRHERLGRRPSPERSFLINTYRQGNIHVGFGRSVPPEFRDPILAAANIWDSYLLIDIAIKVDVAVEEFDEDDSTVAYASSWIGCQADYCVQTSLLNQIRGRDTDARNPDFELVFGESDSWYFGLDGNPGPDQTDLITVALHEFGDGLGFSSGIDRTEGWEDMRRPTADQWVLSGGGTPHFDRYIWTWAWDDDVQDLDSEDMYRAITGHKLLWGAKWHSNSRGEPMRSVRANGGPVMLWADPESGAGSIVNHLDEDAYPDSSRNGLMGPYTNRGEVHHEPGPVALGILYDLGWEMKERAVDPIDVLRCLEGSQ